MCLLAPDEADRMVIRPRSRMGIHGPGGQDLLQVPACPAARILMKPLA